MQVREGASLPTGTPARLTTDSGSAVSLGVGVRYPDTYIDPAPSTPFHPLAEEDLGVQCHLVAFEAEIGKVTTSPREDAFRLVRHDHDVVAVAHPTESVIKFVQVQVGQHRREVRSRTQPLTAEKWVHLPPEDWVKPVDLTLETLLVDRCEEGLEIESDPGPRQTSNVINRCVDAVLGAVAMNAVGEERQDQLIDAASDRSRTLFQVARHDVNLSVFDGPPD